MPFFFGGYVAILGNLKFRYLFFIAFRKAGGRVRVRERKREKERKRERETHIVAFHMPQLGVEPVTWIYVLTGDQTYNLFGVWDDAITN